MINLSENNIFIENCENEYDATVLNPDFMYCYSIYKEYMDFTYKLDNNFLYNLFNLRDKKHNRLSFFEFTKKFYPDENGKSEDIKYKYHTFKKKYTVPSNKHDGELRNTILDKKAYKKLFTDKSQSFITLWQVCQFIKWAEELGFYYNNLDSPIYADANLDDERKFKITTDDKKTDIIFALSMKKDPVNIDMLKIINIKVKRNYGNKIESTYIIVNNNVKYNDSADIYTMNNINILLTERIASVYIMIYRRIWNYAIKYNTSYLEPSKIRTYDNGNISILDQDTL